MAGKSNRNGKRRSNTDKVDLANAGKNRAATTPDAITEVPITPLGKVLGLVVFLVSLAFTVVFLARQGLSDPDSGATVAVPESLAGFRADLHFLPDDETLGFVEIPAGSFIMGSNRRADRMAYDNEFWSARQMQGELTLPRFYIARYETTIAQFADYLRDSGVNSGANLDGPGNLPVTGVTWPEALAYGRWLENKLLDSGELPPELTEFLRSGGHITLPTEAEWEKAGRGESGRIFPWGPQVRTDFANFNSNRLLPVGALPCPPCSYGLSDMAGNVWELTRSPFQDYPFDPGDDLETLESDALWVMRGGSYADPVNNVRAAVRGGVDPGVRNDAIGFRLVISSQ
jgi:formylglycine-generating enzyme required for sulfatase activity